MTFMWHCYLKFKNIKNKVFFLFWMIGSAICAMSRFAQFVRFCANRNTNEEVKREGTPYNRLCYCRDCGISGRHFSGEKWSNDATFQCNLLFEFLQFTSLAVFRSRYDIVVARIPSRFCYVDAYLSVFRHPAKENPLLWVGVFLKSWICSKRVF